MEEFAKEETIVQAASKNSQNDGKPSSWFQRFKDLLSKRERTNK